MQLHVVLHKPKRDHKIQDSQKHKTSTIHTTIKVIIHSISKLHAF